MSQAILEALKKLDPKNDNHWTQEGLPRLETLKFMVGHQGLTREEVTSAAPKFNRDAAIEAAAHAASGPAPAPATPVPAPAPAAPPAPAAAAVAGDQLATQQPPATQGDEQVVEEPELTEAEALKRQLDVAQKDVSEKLAALEKAKVDLEKAQDFFALIEEELHSISAPEENPIQQYLSAQQGLLEHRAEVKRQLNGSGLNLGELARTLKSPIDAALSRKNTRGTQRPSR